MNSVADRSQKESVKDVRGVGRGRSVFVVNMMDFVLKISDFVLELMIFVLKMMKFEAVEKGSVVRAQVLFFHIL